MKHLLLLAILLPALAYGQGWERLPINGGHVTRFIPNIFNENDLFALTPESGILYSSDRGKNWEFINGNLAEVAEPRPSDLVVTKNGWLYATIHGHNGQQSFRLVRSTDWGAHWERMQLADTLRLHPDTPIYTSSDGTIFLHVATTFFNGPDLLLYSVDNGLTWNEYPSPSDLTWRALDIHLIEKDRDRVLWYGNGGWLRRTTDGGMTWTGDNILTVYDDIVDIFEFRRDDVLTFGMWIYHSEFPRHLYYYESIDTGRTWHKVIEDSISVNIPGIKGEPEISKNSTSSTPANKSRTTIVSDGTMFSVYGKGIADNSILRVSRDQGQSWQPLASAPQYPAYDIINYNDMLFCSFLGLGIYTSSDGGKNWGSLNVEELFTFDAVESAFVQDSIGYVVSADMEGVETVSILWQSTNSGAFWVPLYTVRGRLSSLAATTYPEVRYTCMLNDNNVIGGALNQSEPDTLLSDLVSGVFGHEQRQALRNSPPSDGGLYLYASKTGSPQLWYSPDGGLSWDSNPAPISSFEYFHIYPSYLRNDRVFALGGPFFSTQIDDSGFWLAEDFGASWQHRIRFDPVSSWRYTLGRDDLLFNLSDISFSSDYGWSWERVDTGINPAHRDPPMQCFVTEGYFVLTNGLYWYLYEDGNYWQEMRDQHGNPIKLGYIPRDVDRFNGDWYASMPYKGVFRLRNTTTVDVDNMEHVPSDYFIVANPNPFTSVAEITYRIPEAQPVRLVVLNSLGEQVAVLEDGYKQSGEHTAAFNGTGLPSGVYYYRLIAGETAITKSMVLVR